MLKVSCAIIIRQNKILVTQRNSASDHPLQWEFPGGKVNQDETAEDCVIREIGEELEIEIEIRKSMVAVEHDYGFKKIVLIPFLCIQKSGILKLVEHQDFKWIKFNFLKKLDFTEADKKLIQLNTNQKILEKYLWENMHDSR